MRTPFLIGILLAAAVLGGLSGSLAAVWRQPTTVPPASDEPLLAKSLSELAIDLGGLSRRVEALERAPATVERHDLSPTIEERASEPPPAAERSEDPPRETQDPEDPAIAKLTPQLEELLRRGASEEDMQELLGRVQEAGWQDAAIAALQSLIERDPTNPQAHYLLAKAFYARLMLASSPAGYQEWGDKTMSAWERALELDPEYWEARFERTEYLTYFPESEGKTPEVIADLERLIAQPNRAEGDPRRARAYAHLARMYLRVGKRDKAIQTLRDGCARYPEDTDLQQQLAAFDDQ